MKKWIVFLMLFGLAGSSYAGDPGSAHRSSQTFTNEGAYISSSTALTAVIVSSLSAGGTLGIYNSTWTTSSVLISSISLGTIYEYEFYDMPVKGVYYKAQSNAGSFTIIYQR